MRITSNMAEVRRDLSDLAQRQWPYALARGINETGKVVLEENRKAMGAVFDRPRAFTLNAFWWKPATKARPEGSLQRKDMIGRRHYLEVQEDGGARPHTGIESLLAARYPGVGFVTPAKGAPLDGSGNLSGGTVQRMLSQLGAQRDATANQTEASKARAGRSRPTYFVPRRGQLSPGVWHRQGKVLKRLLTFNVKPPAYRARLKFFERAERIGARVLPGKLAEALTAALASRKPR